MKAIKDYNNYSITKDGRVINTVTGKERKISIGDRGYHRVTLYKDNKSKGCNIHRLIAEAYIPNPDNLPVVRHLNDNKDDNRLENLAWGTVADNMKDKYNNGYKHHRRKLSDERVRQIRMLKGEFTQKHLAYLFGVSRSVISKIHNNKEYKEIK